MTITPEPPSDGDRASPRPTVLEVEHLRIEFTTARGPLTVVDDVSFRVYEGHTLGMVGESGSGKTMTGLALLGLLPRGGRIAGGRIRVGDADLLALPERERRRLRGREIAMIFQNASKSLNPAFTVGDQIAESIRRHEPVSRRIAWARALEMLDHVGIADPGRRAHAYPHELSGGMCQRVMIASALVCNPRLLIADEPTSSLDVTIQVQILELLRRLQSEHHMAMILVTHDLGVVAEICDDVVTLYAGQAVERADVFDLFERPKHPYSEALLRSVPQLTGHAPEFDGLAGSVPSPWRFPAGCRFHPRCPYAIPVCREDAPALVEAGARAIRCHRASELELRGAG